MGNARKLKKNSYLIKAILKSKFSIKRNLLQGFRDRKKYYLKTDTNADIKSLMYCMLCPNMCRFDCPAVQASKNESHSPAMKAKIGYLLEMGKIGKSVENILPILEGCVHCSACKEWCFFDFAVGDLLDGVVEDLFFEEKLPESVLKFSNRIRNNNGLYDLEHLKKSTKVLESFSEGEIYYFPGCVTMGNNTNVITAIKKIAQVSKTKIISKPLERWCCGAPSYYSGDIEKAKDLASHNLEHFKSLGIKMIICECPECAHMLKEGYKKIGFEHNIPVYHLSEWIYQLVENKKIKLQIDENSKLLEKSFPVSYHDPCVLARKMNVIDAPYQLLEKMFPTKFKENPYSKKLTHCCGFGGLVNIVNSELANTMSIKRLEEFDKEGIKTIVTSCPTCWYSFMKNNKDLKFEIIDLIELFANFIKD
ncbi:MAG: (Fe-S)-binding protein [Candidatus Heimdallarchaeota archaeon]|nr:(Fe-S)-binding protein [Candidatus Heimdallarchaeota archaeon]